MNKLTTYLKARNLNLKSIEVLIGDNGVVDKVNISGEGLSETTVQEIETLAKAYSYEKLNVNHSWKFRILF